MEQNGRRFDGTVCKEHSAEMSAQEIIEQIKALSAKERAQVAKFVVENDDSWIPESFQQGMADAKAGRLVDLDTALNEPYAGDQ
jgi:predicted transcriptional regulator